MAVQNKFTSPIYALGYGHQRDFLSSNFEAVLKSNDSILDEFITCIENDLTRDYMLGLRQFPDEVPPECYVIKDVQFKASSTPFYSQQTEKQVYYLRKVPNEALKSDDMALPINKVHWDGIKFVPRNNCNSRLVVESEDEDYDAYAADDLEDQELSKVIITCELIQKFINTRIYGIEGIRRSYAFWMFPYVLLKSVILVHMLKWNITIPTHL